MVALAQFGNVPANLQSNALLTIAIVNEVFGRFPNRFRFTSGYRSPERNSAVNGVANSYHLTGEAADFVPIDGRFPAGEQEAIAAVVSKYGYEVIKHDAGSGLHYHIEPMPSGKVASGVPIAGGISAGLILFGFIALFLIFDD